MHRYDAEPAGGSAVGYRLDDRSRTEGLIRSAGPLTAMGGLVFILVAVLALREGDRRFESFLASQHARLHGDLDWVISR